MPLSVPLPKLKCGQTGSLSLGFIATPFAPRQRWRLRLDAASGLIGQNTVSMCL
jgi:hypothetical protein